MLAVALADLLFDGHPRVVRHLLLQPGKQVEKCGFPRVRVAHNGDEWRFSRGLAQAAAGEMAMKAAS